MRAFAADRADLFHEMSPCFTYLKHSERVRFLSRPRLNTIISWSAVTGLASRDIGIARRGLVPLRVAAYSNTSGKQAQTETTVRPVQYICTAEFRLSAEPDAHP